MDVDDLLGTGKQPNSYWTPENCEKKIYLPNLPVGTFGTDVTQCLKELGVQIEYCSVREKVERGEKRCLAVVEFKSRKQRNFVLRDHSKLSINGKEVTVRPFVAIDRNLHREGEDYPFVVDNLRCCGTGACAYLKERSFHCSLVSSPDQPHPSSSARYDRSALIKLNPRKTRMPGYFKSSGAVFRIAPEIFELGPRVGRKSYDLIEL